VFYQYLSRLQLLVGGVLSDRPLTASTFRGPSISCGLISVRDHPNLDFYWAQLAAVQDGFWRLVFASLATDELPPLCRGCGKQLGKTPGGRWPRADVCKKCRFREWYDKQPEEKHRARWRRNKAAERAATKKNTNRKEK